MSSKPFSFWVSLPLCGLLGGPAFGQEQVPADPGAGVAGAAAVAAVPEGAGQDAIEVMDQGPVHEAFAEPVVLEAAKQIVVDNAPPDPVNELPPDVKPEGNNVQWISGYWMWSEPRNDFIWVSGVWRDIPPGRRWVPGHWLKAAGGFEWAPGFWADEAVEQVNLLPVPPETLEAGPTSPAPADNYFWIPGCWVWQNSDYVWRAGYWYAGQPNWVWVPDHYSYTSYGAYYVSGYWDYPLVSRGLLYAPVYWSRPIYTRPGYFYRPYSVVNSALLLTALFVNPYHSHYYYGYGSWGNNFYRPWWSWGWGGRVYDPFYSYHRWHDGRNRHDWHDHVRRDWDRHHHHDHDGPGRGDWHRGDGDREGRGPRPGSIAGRDDVNRLVTNVDDLRRQRGGSVQLNQLDRDELRRVTERSKNWQQIREARTAAESDAAARLGRVNVGEGNAARDVDAVRRGSRGSVRAGVGTDGDASARIGNTGPDGGRRLRIDGDGSPRASFKLPAVERSAGAGGQAAARGRATVPGGQSDATNRIRGSVQRDGNPAAIGSGNVNRDAINRRFNLPSGGQVDGGQNATRTLPGRVDSGRSQLPQGGSLTTPGGNGNRIDIPRSNQPGRSFRYNPGQAPGNSGGSPGAIEQRSFRVPSGGGSNIRIPSGNSGGGSRIQVPSGGGSSIRIPSGGGRSFGTPSGSAGQRSFSVPSGSSQRSFGTPPGGGQRSFSAPSGGRQSIRVPSGGGGNFRGFSGGGPSVRGGGGGGGGQQMFRGGGGGGGSHRALQGGGGNRGGGGRGRN